MEGNRHRRKVAGHSISRETENTVRRTQQSTWAQRWWRGKQDQKKMQIHYTSEKAVRDWKPTCKIMISGRGLHLAIFLLFSLISYWTFIIKSLNILVSVLLNPGMFFSLKIFWSVVKESSAKYHGQIAPCTLGQIIMPSAVRRFMQPCVRIPWGNPIFQHSLP